MADKTLIESPEERAMNQAVFEALVGVLTRALPFVREGFAAAQTDEALAQYREVLRPEFGQVNLGLAHCESLIRLLSAGPASSEPSEYLDAKALLETLAPATSPLYKGSDLEHWVAVLFAPVLLSLPAHLLWTVIEVWDWSYWVGNGFRHDFASERCWDALGRISIHYPSLFMVCGNEYITEGVRVWLELALREAGVSTGAWTAKVEGDTFVLSLVQLIEGARVKDCLRVVPIDPAKICLNMERGRYEMIPT